MELIKCKDVSKSFGEKVALDNVSLDIPKGKIFGLLGPNGAGKTTLIRIINRITIPNSGSVLFNGQPITQDDVEKIGYLPEERGLYRKMKVGEQAMYFAQLKGMSVREAGNELKKWFVRFGIESWWNTRSRNFQKVWPRRYSSSLQSCTSLRCSFSMSLSPVSILSMHR